MENIVKSQHDDNSIIIVDDVKDYLFEIAKWGKFLAIIGYVSSGLIIVLAISILFAMPSLGDFGDVHFITISLIYLFIALIQCVPVTYLYRFSKQIKIGLIVEDTESINFGFKNLKSLFKFAGISAIITLSIYALVFLVFFIIWIYSQR